MSQPTVAFNDFAQKQRAKTGAMHSYLVQRRRTRSALADLWAFAAAVSIALQLRAHPGELSAQVT
jgi:hypothetical protein